MSLSYIFQCSIINSSTGEPVAELGNFRWDILYSNNAENVIAYRQLDESDTSYFQDMIVDGILYGSNPVIQNQASYDTHKRDDIRAFAPGYEKLVFPDAFATSDYAIKGTNTSGYYFITPTLNYTGATGSDVYDNEDNRIGVIPIGIIRQAPTPGSCFSYTIITDVDPVIPVTGDASFYASTFNSDRYKSGYEITSPNKTPLITFINGLTEYEEDPYDPGGTSGTGGGTGNFDGTSDAISIPSLPTLSAVDTGFITLFNPTISQLGNLASYMWSSAFDLDNFRKLFADPMEAILGMSIVPVAVPSAGAAAVKVGNISTGVSMTKAASQYVSVDCGTINVNEYWGAYLDYAPYTECQIYLPYCGTHPVNTDDVMNNSVHVVYHVDILSGACCAYVQCGQSVMYEFVGQCSVSVPITGNNWTNMINGALSIAASIGSMVATGGASAPLAAAGLAQTAVNSFKPSVEKSGSMGGMGGMLGVQVPYLILTRPRQALPENQKHFTGYPSFITRTMSSLSGYTEIAEVHLETMTATSGEIAEIEQLLKGGVIF